MLEPEALGHTKYPTPIMTNKRIAAPMILTLVMFVRVMNLLIDVALKNMKIIVDDAYGCM